jgi:hypothetical protein
MSNPAYHTYRIVYEPRTPDPLNRGNWYLYNGLGHQVGVFPSKNSAQSFLTELERRLAEKNSDLEPA